MFYSTLSNENEKTLGTEEVVAMEAAKAKNVGIWLLLANHDLGGLDTFCVPLFRDQVSRADPS